MKGKARRRESEGSSEGNECKGGPNEKTEKERKGSVEFWVGLLVDLVAEGEGVVRSLEGMREGRKSARTSCEIIRRRGRESREEAHLLGDVGRLSFAGDDDGAGVGVNVGRDTDDLSSVEVGAGGVDLEEEEEGCSSGRGFELGGTRDSENLGEES